MRRSRTALLAALLGVLLLRALIRATPVPPPRAVSALAAYCDPKEEAAGGGKHAHHEKDASHARGAHTSGAHAKTGHSSALHHGAAHASNEVHAHATAHAATPAPRPQLESHDIVSEPPRLNSAMALLSPATTLTQDAFDAPVKLP